jgi:hypothetical protein
MPYKSEAKRGERSKEWRDRRRKIIIDLLGGVCVVCGFDDQRALQFDHIHGNGIQDRKQMSTQHYLTYVLNSVMARQGKFQLLCANCNWIKRVENHEVRKR